MPSRDTAAFLAGLSAQARAAIEAVADPKVLPDGFVEFLIARVKPGDLPDLKELALADLHVVWGALAQHPAALAIVDRHVREVLDRERKRNPGVDFDEVQQLVARTLLVTEPGRPPALVGYSGRGPLAAWLRVIAVRELVRVRKAGRRGAAESVEALADRVAPNDDPELEFLKRHYRVEFRAAFAAAVQTLDERERNLLRHHFIDGLTIDDLGTRFDVHRATAARWLQKARDDLARATRAELARRLELDSADLDSLIRLVVTRLELSLKPLRSEG